MGALKDLWIEAVEENREREFQEWLDVAKEEKKETNLALTLASLAIEASQLAQELLITGGELTKELEEKLAVNQYNLAQKADSYAFILEEFDSHAELWKKRKDACASQQKKFENQRERLSTRIKEALRIMDQTEVKGTYHGFKLRRCKPKLLIDDESQIPNEFKLIIQTTSIDRGKIESVLRDGISIPGARLEESTSIHPIHVLKKGSQE